VALSVSKSSSVCTSYSIMKLREEAASQRRSSRRWTEEARADLQYNRMARKMAVNSWLFSEMPARARGKEQGCASADRPRPLAGAAVGAAEAGGWLEAKSRAEAKQRCVEQP
jgi:hypothetical protein